MTSDSINPYEPPRTRDELARPTGRPRLASRPSRLGAVLLDTVVIMVIAIPILAVTGMFEQMMAGREQPLGEQLLWAIASFVIVVAINGYLLATRAQTIGKRLVGIKIARTDGTDADFNTIVFRRMLPFHVIYQIPVAGIVISLIDPLFIFRSDRRCLHDFVADTIVVDAGTPSRRRRPSRPRPQRQPSPQRRPRRPRAGGPVGGPGSGAPERGPRTG